MHNSPSTEELIASVMTFLTEVAVPQLTGHAQFHARVSANALALVARDLAARTRQESDSIARYQALLKSDESELSVLEQSLCEHIRSNAFDVKTPGLLDALRAIASAQLRVDQPTYSGLKL
jgi:hypothetical protein